MKNFDDLTETQQGAINFLYENDSTLLDGKMGGGKTICTLTAAAELLRDGELKKVLVVAPLKVARTVWAEEAADWGHTECLNVVKCLGDASERKKALAADADIVVINFDNLIWLMDLFKKDKTLNTFDGLVIDELTKLKAAGSKMFKALRRHLSSFKWRVGLTGTAVSEDWLGLYAMMLVLDSGARLGTSQDAYRRKYFYQADYQGYQWELQPWAAAAIGEKISDIVYTMADYRSELEKPSYEIFNFDMLDTQKAAYAELKNTSILNFVHTESGASKTIEAVNAAVLSGKLQQLASGFLYLDDDIDENTREWECFSSRRIDALRECLNTVTGPVLIAYWYKADLAAIKALLPNAVELNSGSGVEANVRAWNNGEIDALLVHPRSAGHGLNLAQGGHTVIWYSPTWSRDLYEQTNARLWRRGQTKTVRIIELVANDSIDELIRQRVEDKKDFEALWQKHLES